MILNGIYILDFMFLLVVHNAFMQYIFVKQFILLTQFSGLVQLMSSLN